MTCRPPEAYADPRDVTALAQPLQERVGQLIEDAPTGGLMLISGLRTPFQQWLLRRDRCPGRECDPACKGRPLTALPGRSNHQKGLAADLGGRELEWARARYRAYGLHQPMVSEPWHVELYGTPTVPIGPRKPTRPAPWLPWSMPDNDPAIQARGGQTHQVGEIQIRLRILAGSWNAPDVHPGTVDGYYGTRTGHAVTAFKRRIIDLQELVGTKRWPNTDTNVGHLTIAMMRWWTP